MCHWYCEHYESNTLSGVRHHILIMCDGLLNVCLSEYCVRARME